MENYTWDAVAFVPKRNITFHGFGICSNYEKKDMLYKFKWQIDNEAYDEVDYDIADEQKDPEKLWFEINLKDLGHKPINVSEG